MKRRNRKMHSDRNKNAMYLKQQEVVCAIKERGNKYLPEIGTDYSSHATVNSHHLDSCISFIEPRASS